MRKRILNGPPARHAGSKHAAKNVTIGLCPLYRDWWIVLATSHDAISREKHGLSMCLMTWRAPRHRMPVN